MENDPRGHGPRPGRGRLPSLRESSGADPAGTELFPFAEPGACVLHLTRAEAPAPVTAPAPAPSP